jgi:hypothetical protein
VATNPNDAAARKLIGKFARTLLATTCLTVASAGAALANACTYNEGNAVETFPPIVSLSAAATSPGTTTTCGNIAMDGGTSEFELTGLGSGTYTVSAITTGAQGFLGEFLYIATDSGFSNLVVNDEFFSGTGPLSVPVATIPADGDLYFKVQHGNESADSFSVAVTTTAAPGGVPEPSTLAMAGLGLAGALALGRKRRKQQ